MRLHDYDDVVAAKFFPIDGPDSKQQPLFEMDYSCRLNLICAKCGLALRGSYITACSQSLFVDSPSIRSHGSQTRSTTWNTLCLTLFAPGFFGHVQTIFYSRDLYDAHILTPWLALPLSQVSPRTS